MEGNQDSQKISFSILNNILEDLHSFYLSKDEIPKKVEKKKNKSLSQILNEHSVKMIRKLKYKKNVKEKEVYFLHHVSVHHQYIKNFCGYHALYNLMEACKLIKSAGKIKKFLFNDPVSFWSYVFETNKFLWSYGQLTGKDTTAWPWTFYHTHYGDFERTFLKVIKTSRRFSEVFSSDENTEINFYHLDYQYSNLIFDDQVLCKLEKEIAQMHTYKTNMVFAFMLGACTHWISFLVHKTQDNLEFYLFDSKNLDYLEYTEDQINQYIEKKSDEKLKAANMPISYFHKELGKQTIRDANKIVDLIINCFLGKTSFYKYVNDRKFEILYDTLILETPDAKKYIEENSLETYFSYENENIELILNSLDTWCYCYYSALNKFFEFFHGKNDIDEEYGKKFDVFMEFLCCLYEFIDFDRKARQGKKVSVDLKNILKAKKFCTVKNKS